MIGPKNGIIFSSAHTSDIVTAFGIPIVNKIIVQMKNKTVTCIKINDFGGSEPPKIDRQSIQKHVQKQYCKKYGS